MLIAIGVVTGLLLGVWATCVWGLRKAKRVGPELLLVVLALSPILLSWGADASGWPTPGSIAESTGAVTDSAGHGLLVGIEFATAAVVVAVLVRAGATRRLESWSTSKAE
ncbi:hypothetical protein GCU60_17275 [Blastococcus saxobsidens]|uniref:Uncharacterized protein n=1 Tax=Blastococcus saxobsidens TaxID=138336 RepID=A0A6L9W607_9ACTN|nr:hypothetical protein [Blastococcus saxobsidens]NEK87495.1 hypothetical protein [Blastococcus saxobsidens]